MPDSSFISIPKPPKLLSRKKGAGLFLTISVLMLVISFAIFGGAFFYKQYLQRQRTAVAASLERLEADFEPSLLMELNRVSQLLSTAKLLLQSHVSTSRIFQFIEDNVFNGIRFSSFSFDAEKMSLRMNGEAGSYTVLAGQAAAFEESRFVESVSLSNLSLQPNGDVGFAVSIRFKSPILNYQ